MFDGDVSVESRRTDSTNMTMMREASPVSGLVSVRALQNYGMVIHTHTRQYTNKQI